MFHKYKVNKIFFSNKINAATRRIKKCSLYVTQTTTSLKTGRDLTIINQQNFQKVTYFENYSKF